MPEEQQIREQPAPPEREKQRPFSPETSRMVALTIIPEMVLPENSFANQTQIQKIKSEISSIMPKNLPTKAIAELSGDERREEYALHKDLKQAYKDWREHKIRWFDRQDDDAKREIKSTFARVGISVNDHLEQKQIDTFFDKFLDMEDQNETYQNKYDAFVNGVVDEFIIDGDGKKLDRKGLDRRIDVLKPLLTSFGKEDIVVLIDAHIKAHGFISQDDETRRTQADEIIAGVDEGVSSGAAIRGFRKLGGKMGQAPQLGQPQKPSPADAQRQQQHVDENETPTEIIGQPKTEAEIDKLLHDAQVKLGRPLNDSEKIYVAQTGDISKLESVDIDNLLSSILSAQKNPLEHGVFEPAFQRIQELAKKGDTITPEEIEEHRVLLKKLRLAQVILTSPEDIDVFATVTNLSPAFRQNILNSYRSFDANPKKPDTHLTAFILTFEKDEDGKPQIQPLIPDYIPANAPEQTEPSQKQAETITVLTEDEQLANLEQDAPELLEARLPEELERKLPEGFRRYFLGINQTGGVQSVEEATALLKSYGGIDMAGYGRFEQRFDLMDHQYLKGGKWTRDFYGPIHGHFGENIGRFVAVFPVDETKDTDMTPGEIAMEGYEYYPKDHPDYPYPKDLLAKGKGTREREGTVVNNKYIAGFIDVQGHFHPNPDFMK